MSSAKEIDIEIAEHDRETIIKKKSSELTKPPKAIEFGEIPLETIEINSDDDNAPPQELITLFETEFAKIPSEDDLKFLDPISLYECKIQTILLIQKVFSRYVTIGQKPIEKNQDDTFLGIEINLLTEILGEK